MCSTFTTVRIGHEFYSTGEVDPQNAPHFVILKGPLLAEGSPANSSS